MGYQVNIPEFTPSETVIIMDTTYFRRNFGVMIFRDHYTGKNIYWQYIRNETIELYKHGIQLLKIRGWKIKGIVCDGRKGLFKAFGDTPVQMCHFHQTAIIRRYLTQNPRSEPNMELKELSLQLKDIDKESWIFLLEQWHERWRDYLKEKTVDPDTGKWHYTHKRLRSAFRSMKTNTPHLFAFQDHSELMIPNTTNPLEGIFSELKTKLRNHSGIKDEMKMKLTDLFLLK
jgi:hypothetical protein